VAAFRRRSSSRPTLFRALYIARYMPTKMTEMSATTRTARAAMPTFLRTPLMPLARCAPPRP
jgi:hypothetical protein